MDMEIRSLTPEEEDARLSALHLAARLVGGSPPLSVDQVQALYCVIRDDYLEYEDAHIALGIAFGELIAAEASYEWVRVTDEYGSETSLAPPGFAGACHPISMIQKRIERREDVDIAEMRDGIIEMIRQGVDEGRWAPRKSDQSA